MDSHALSVLEFARVLETAAGFTATQLARETLLELRPSASYAICHQLQKETSEARRLLDAFGGMRFGGASNILPLVAQAKLGSFLDGKDLLDIHGTIEAGEGLALFLRKHADLAPSLFQLASGVTALPKLSTAIAAAIDHDGSVKDSASDKLAKVRSEIRTSQNRIQDKLNHIISSTGTRDALQDPVVVSRHGRWCVPVRSSHKASVPGIVHDASASGATLFIEPQSVVELGNKLRELEAVEKEEVERILRTLTADIAANADDLNNMMEVINYLDVTNAKALFADCLKCNQPTLKEGAFFKFFQARHPLLTGDVIPIDVYAGGAFKGLLITGPNTGGKTVTLKTIGLLVLMAQSGMQIPAEQGSQCGVFTDIFADIGDEQSIEQSLSTFSGHVRNIVHTLTNLTAGSLVLFDELGAGTDPDEGAALASAILSCLAEKDVCCVATSHYPELKAFAFTNHAFENASVEFDRQSLRPTYRLLIGVPGESQALHIAERLGMPADVMQQARELMAGNETAADELIRQVEQSRTKAIEEERKAMEALSEAEGLKDMYYRDLSKLLQTRDQVRDQLQAEALKAIKQTQAELDKVLRELRTQKRHSQNTEGLANKAKRLMKNMEKTAESVAQKAPLPKAAPVPPKPEPVELKKGDKVRMIGVGTIGTLLSDPDGDEVVVAFGAMEARLSKDRIEPAGKDAVRKAVSGGSGTQKIQMSRALSVSPEIMLRGERVEQALERLDRYLDDAVLAGLDRVRVIHGKGTGVMRKAVWEYMRTHPNIAHLEMATADEGGEGATIARLK